MAAGIPARIFSQFSSRAGCPAVAAGLCRRPPPRRAWRKIYLISDGYALRIRPAQSPISHHMSKRVFFWSLTSALAGFLFGFDMVVISGAEQTIQSLWGLGVGMHGVAMAAALYGTVLGSLLAGWPTDRFGRRATLLWIGALYLISAVWSALATDVYSFIIARMIGGVW